MFKTLVSAIDTRKNPTSDEIRKIPSYIFCRWLSGHPIAIKAAQQINLFSDIPIVNQYNMIKSAFGGKIKFIPYPKNVSVKTDKKIEYLSLYFKISEEKARDYLGFISKKELKEIVQMYEQLEEK